MVQKLVEYSLLFEVVDPLGRKIRTTKSYWKKIKTVKHQELRYSTVHIKQTITNPTEIRRSVTDSTVLLYMRKAEKYDKLVVAVKILNNKGFIVTAYQTKKYKPKGELLWQEKRK